MDKKFLYRLSQLLAFVLGTKLLVVALLTIALYISTFFLFNQEESFRNFVFDFRVHGIIFCSVLSIGAGGIINQFYDKEKDKVTRPFRTKIQSFLKQKYFLYAYIILNLVSLIVAFYISWRVFVFFIIYQFFMWLYSHKLSKILILNNMTFVSLTLYPFFGMLIYYQTFSMKIFLMATFLFGILLVIDILKDTLTKNVDEIFGYKTIPNYFSKNTTKLFIVSILLLLIVNSFFILTKNIQHSVMWCYYLLGILLFAILIFYYNNSAKNSKYYIMNILRLWLFLGIIAMMIDGIIMRV